MNSQNAIRRKALDARRSLNPAEREIASLSICDHIIATRWFRKAKAIGCYLAADDEVAMWSLIERALRRNKRIFVPVVGKRSTMQFVELQRKSEFQRNRFGLQEPVTGKSIAATQLDLVIAPLVAFDKTGNRIGMGGGFYDRTFAFLRHRHRLARPRLLGAAFDCQRVNEIAANPWDIPLLDVITQSGFALSHRQ